MVASKLTPAWYLNTFRFWLQIEKIWKIICCCLYSGESHSPYYHIRELHLPTLYTLVSIFLLEIIKCLLIFNRRCYLYWWRGVIVWWLAVMFDTKSHFNYVYEQSCFPFSKSKSAEDQTQFVFRMKAERSDKEIKTYILGNVLCFSV